MSKHALVSLAVVPAGLLLLFHAARYYPYLTDDALISLRYADRLVDGLGLTWTDGDRVEGYSNLTWVLANALLHWLGLDLIVASRLLGAAGLLGALWCVVAWEGRESERGLWSGCVAATAAAVTGALAVWMIGGLEQPLVVLFLSLALLACRSVLAGDLRSLRGGAVCLAMLCLSRPDGALLSGAVILAFGSAYGLSRESLRLSFRLAWPSAAAVVGQLAFRLLYYHDWIPNTARAKLSFGAERLTAGLAYLQHGLEFLWPLLAAALLSTLLGRAFSRTMWLIWLPLAIWTAYVALIGGDFFPGRRLLVPVVVLLAFVIASGLAGILSTLPRPMLGLVPCVALLVLQIPLTWFDPENTHALIAAPWAANDQVLGRLLKRAFHRQQPLLAVDAAGSLPYFSELPSVDILGLNDRYLAHHPPPDFGKRMIGHELGDAAYIARRRPDLMVICLTGNAPPIACFRPDRELLQRADFQRDYQLVRFRGRDPHLFEGNVFVRRQGRVGMQTRGHQLVVPGFFFAAGGVGVAALDAKGRLGAELPAHVETQLALPKECAGCRVQVDAEPSVRAELTSPRTLRIVTDGPTHVRNVVLTR